MFFSEICNNPQIYFAEICTFPQMFGQSSLGQKTLVFTKKCGNTIIKSFRKLVETRDTERGAL